MPATIVQTFSLIAAIGGQNYLIDGNLSASDCAALTIGPSRVAWFEIEGPRLITVPDDAPLYCEPETFDLPQPQGDARPPHVPEVSAAFDDLAYNRRRETQIVSGQKGIWSPPKDTKPKRQATPKAPKAPKESKRARKGE